MTDDRLRWLLQRQSGLGGSDIGALMGVSPYSTPLDIYFSKVNADISDNENIAMRRGHFLEPFIASLYEEHTGHIARPNGDTLYRHPIMDFMIVTPDYWFVKPYETDNKEYLLEIKSVVGRGAAKWYDGVPEYIQCQCQHQMYVTGTDVMDLAFLIDDDFAYLTIYRNELLIDSMLAVASDFWYNYVLEKKMPEPVTANDYKRYYTAATAGSTVVASRELLLNIGELLELKALEKHQDELHKTTKRRIDELDFAIRSYIKDKETLVDEDNQIIATYKSTSNGRRTLRFKITEIY